MPRLLVRHPDGSSRAFPLVKRITAVGSAPDNDVSLPGIPDSALHLELDHGELRLTGHRGTDYTLNGKKRAQGKLSDQDVIALGGASLTVELVDSMPGATPLPDGAATSDKTDEIQLLRSLVALSERIMGRGDVQAVLEDLLDAAISLTNADKGFLILAESDRLSVRVARNIEAPVDIEDAERGVSDSIVKKVLDTRRPLVVHDALHDEEFGQSESVVNLKLCSVVCAPLLEKGDLIGLLYLGNDRFAHRFEERALGLLTVFAAQASLIVRNALLARDLRLESAQLKRQLEEAQYGELIGACPGMREIYRRIDKVAGTDISVLVGGETGTGKEMLAREVHRRSARVKGPFVAINCGAIPENLLESELFGHVRGAFTGAVATRQGKFQAANGGTLFLDEVGDMPMSLQVKILRALQERTVVKVGDTRPEAVDIRVVAASHRVLEDEVKSGRFREDLYYRLNVIRLV
ncbi:MAG: sigma 54-interacting transcriptional regulator, partial [Deltaproteobacteria bacterium]